MGQKGKKWPKTTKRSVCHTSYLRKHTSYDFHSWYTCIKWYLELFFSFCQNCDFLGCQENKREKNVLKWEKILSVTLHISETIRLMIFIYAFMVQMIISPVFFVLFFILSKFWFSRFLGGRGSEGQKIVYKKLCPLHLISKEPYIIWLSFVVHKCKLMISPGFFFKILNLQ